MLLTRLRCWNPGDCRTPDADKAGFRRPKTTWPPSTPPCQPAVTDNGTAEKGLIYKNRLSKYCFAVPLFGGFINRRFGAPELLMRE
jgi:hypothetical protein